MRDDDAGDIYAADGAGVRGHDEFFGTGGEFFKKIQPFHRGRIVAVKRFSGCKEIPVFINGRKVDDIFESAVQVSEKPATAFSVLIHDRRHSRKASENIGIIIKIFI